MERTNKVRNFWTMSAMKSQKAAEDSQTKENINDTRGFVLLQTQMAFFPGSRNTKRKLSFLILIKAKSVGNMISPLLIKLVRSRWLDISLVVFLRFYELTRSQVPYNAKKGTRSISSHFDLTLAAIRKQIFILL